MNQSAGALGGCTDKVHAEAFEGGAYSRSMCDGASDAAASALDGALRTTLACMSSEIFRVYAPIAQLDRAHGFEP